MPASFTLTDVITAIAMLAAGAGVFYAARQLQLSQKSAREEFLLHLFELVQRYNPIHLRLEEGDWSASASEQEWMELNRYMGLIEHIKLLVDDRILNLRTVDRIFSHRVHAIVSNPAVRRRNLEDRKEIWKDFIELWRALESQPSFAAYSAFAMAEAAADDRLRTPAPGDS